MERSNKNSLVLQVLKNEFLMRILTALFYGTTSFLIIVVNKIVLTTYRFPSSQVLGLGQMLATIVVLGLGKRLHLISFPDMSRNLPRKVRFLPPCAAAILLSRCLSPAVSDATLLPGEPGAWTERHSATQSADVHCPEEILHLDDRRG